MRGLRTGPVQPQTRAALTRLIVRSVLDTRASVGIVRLGIDGPVQADTDALADDLAAALAADAVPVARVRAVHFLRARSLRLEYGRDDPDAFFDGWYDWVSLRREVLDPLGPGGSRHWLPRLRDPDSDRPYRDARMDATPGTVAVVSGRFLGRWELVDAFDLLVLLDVTPPARARRVPVDEQARVLPGWDRYLAECHPAERAGHVVRFDHPDRPALVGAEPG